MSRRKARCRRNLRRIRVRSLRLSHKTSLCRNQRKSALLFQARRPLAKLPRSLLWRVKEEYRASRRRPSLISKPISLHSSQVQRFRPGIHLKSPRRPSLNSLPTRTIVSQWNSSPRCKTATQSSSNWFRLGKPKCEATYLPGCLSRQ